MAEVNETPSRLVRLAAYRVTRQRLENILATLYSMGDTLDRLELRDSAEMVAVCDARRYVCRASNALSLVLGGEAASADDPS